MLLATAALLGFLSTNRAEEAKNARDAQAKAAPAADANVVQVAASKVNVRDYGAIGDGVADDTAALQAALEAAATKGPICFVPAGHYRVDGALSVPPGVTLAGASGGAPHSEHPIGTVLLAFGGRGQPDAPPLITLKPNAVIRNLTIHYPEQTLPEVVFGHGPGNAVITQSGADICATAVRVDRTQGHAGVQFVNGQFMSTLCVGEKNEGPVKLTNCGFWPVPETREQVVKLGPSTLLLTACHFAGWDSARKGHPCLRAAGGRLVVSGCEFMAEGRQPIVLEKGLKAATITGCLFRGEKAVSDKSSADVQTGLNTTQ